MVIYTAKLRPRRLLRILLPLLAALALLVLVRGLLTRPAAALSDNGARVEYLRALGLEVAPEPLAAAELTIPEELTGALESYAALQAAQGYPFAAHRGCRAVRYTYAVENYPSGEEGVQANLLICEGEVVAGDLCCPALDGWLRALRSG